MFRNDLFNNTPYENCDNGFKTLVTFNWDHAVFKGHFPSKPVVPGVLLMQIVKECLEGYSGVETNIGSADLKFINPITPAVSCPVMFEVSFKVENVSNYKVRSIGHAKGVTFFKINMELFKGV